MFGLFKKTSWDIKGKAYEFFNEIFNQLPNEYDFLSEGLNKGLYKRFSVNKSLQGHFYSIGFDPSQSDKSSVKGKNFQLNNIIIYQNGKEFYLNITIYEGLWISFEINDTALLQFHEFQIDLSKLRKTKGKFEANSEIAMLVKGLSSKELELDNLSEFNLDGELYYQIKDLEDGNYIALNRKGQVFGLLHDPFKIELINESIRSFVEDVNSGGFKFETYLTDGRGNS